MDWRHWLEELKYVKSIIVEGPSDMLLPPSTTHHSPLRKHEAWHGWSSQVVQEKDKVKDKDKDKDKVKYKDKDKDKDMVDLPR